MADAAARVGVLPVDQLADGVPAVAHDARRHALGDRGHPPADDQHAVIVAGHVRLDDDIAVTTLVPGWLEGLLHVVVRAQVEAHPAAVVAVERLDHDRIADALGSLDRTLGRAHHLRARHGQPGRAEQLVGEALVRREVDRDGRSARGHRRADALLVDALAQLDQARLVEADERDVARHGLVDQRLGGRPKGLALGQADEPRQLIGEVELDLVRGDEVVEQRDGDAARLAADFLLAVLIDDVITPRRPGAARLAQARLGAGQALQLERDMLGDVAQPRSVTQPGDETAAPAQRAGVAVERGQQLDECLVETRECGRSASPRARPGRRA